MATLLNDRVPGSEQDSEHNGVRHQEGVQQEHRSQRLSTWSTPERRPDASRADHSPDNESQENAHPEYRLRLHHRLGANDPDGRGTHTPPNSCHNETT
jgi:hypothetical protein